MLVVYAIQRLSSVDRNTERSGVLLVNCSALLCAFLAILPEKTHNIHGFWCLFNFIVAQPISKGLEYRALGDNRVFPVFV